MRAVVTTVILLSCSSSTPSDRPLPPPVPRVVRRAPDAPQAAVALEPDAGPPPAAPGMITDEECLRRGGHIETEETWAHLRRDRPDGSPPVRYRICRIPSPRNGEECRGDGDCAGGRCFCTGDLDGPDVAHRHPELLRLDGSPAVGHCSDGPVPSGSWYCLVEGGRVMIHGIIVD